MALTTEDFVGLFNTDIPRFIALHFIVVYGCYVFYKLKARPSTSKKMMMLYCGGVEPNLQYHQGMSVLFLIPFRC